MHWTIFQPPVFMTNYLPPSVRGYFPELVEAYTLCTAMAPEKRTMLLHPDDVGRFEAAALVDPGHFSHRAIEIGDEALTVEQVARAISKVNERKIVVTFSPRCGRASSTL